MSSYCYLATVAPAFKYGKCFLMGKQMGKLPDNLPISFPLDKSIKIVDFRQTNWPPVVELRGLFTPTTLNFMTVPALSQHMPHITGTKVRFFFNL
ncbi:hypothetical protein CAEBREN_05820 [Caenorhabditis brenneri]|uniref:Uncharacterized protein n=1 Tax=Caenorhabditis brenneri TaxID=135651 RepID=G0NQU0_CAEBE|nr:hypothetical protein CAEBREN_05820 [Caenorhabditis brenneri]